MFSTPYIVNSISNTELLQKPTTNYQNENNETINEHQE